MTQRNSTTTLSDSCSGTSLFSCPSDTPATFPPQSTQLVPPSGSLTPHLATPDSILLSQCGSSQQTHSPSGGFSFTRTESEGSIPLSDRSSLGTPTPMYQ